MSPHRHPREALPQRCLVVEEAVAHGEVVIEHVVEDGPVEVPLKRLGHHLVAVPAGNVDAQPEHICREELARVIIKWRIL